MANHDNWPYLLDAQREQARQLASHMNAPGSVGGSGQTKVPSSPLARLKGIEGDLRGYSTETLLELDSYGQDLAAAYNTHGIPVPEWLTKALKRLKTGIAETWRRERQLALDRAEAELKELRSKEERRIAKAEEVEKLRKELGYGEDA